MTDTSKEAVESFIKTELTEIARSTGLLVSEEDVEACKEAAKIMRALLSERDALRAQLQAARDEALEEALDAVIKNAPRFGPEGPATSEEYGESEGFRTAVQTIRALKSTSAEGEG